MMATGDPATVCGMCGQPYYLATGHKCFDPSVAYKIYGTTVQDHVVEIDGEPNNPLDAFEDDLLNAIEQETSEEKCYNACASINPSDPVKVAENIGELVWAVKALEPLAARESVRATIVDSVAFKRLRAALSSIGVE